MSDEIDTRSHPREWSREYVELGKDGYPAEWHDTIKHAVREDAGHRCVRCLHPFVCGSTPGHWSPCSPECVHRGPYRITYATGEVAVIATDGCAEAGYALASDWRIVEKVEAEWRVLTVHHLDGNKANCRWWNLTALCQRCHLEVQGRVKMERVYPWPHSDWFRPYVAGYYAWTYLGEDISREEAIERMPELLALEQMAA